MSDYKKHRMALLEETCFRCAACGINITPRSYIFLRDGKDRKDNNNKFYQNFDIAHIDEQSNSNLSIEEKNDFENLLALCVQCHRDQHNGAISKTDLKRLKLRWMIDSGRYTRVEIDSIFGIYKAYLHKVSNYVFYRIDKIDNKTEVNKKIPFKAAMSIPRNMLFLFERAIASGLLIIDPQIEKGINLPPIGSPLLFQNHDLLITEKGLLFCKRFNISCGDE